MNWKVVGKLFAGFIFLFYLPVALLGLGWQWGVLGTVMHDVVDHGFSMNAAAQSMMALGITIVILAIGYGLLRLMRGITSDFRRVHGSSVGKRND